ncbi:D-alanyl-D-alanine carboxypeptidase/D-alanyl-D-alanine-endopeptidase [Oceanobacillus piezotolerans]|uniref:D-alanyl-D-alanine carboxypeptidase/D-alanyl-D-alanine-endopeptidase n=1 Tax=Oceanobacillus piezotolerans TaxID=2448030 RepID=A0A498D421_9BACI|nr:D-alanyl-D-alanine carboxypeptidase/D-alanyl-D-alanine-endopeptidase [Oceanobacillus piezotolerans]RLL43615.1 D-alanyl-D-alanine carboxypeptidase/D-alanyl-D-alanine-endopeptidase [Oceanobacillus piezotolerans]
MKAIKANVALFLFVVVMSAVVISTTNGEQPHASEENANAEETAGSLEEQINALLKNERLDGAVTGISVRKADTGEEIYSHDGNIQLHPASNMKLLTAAAALETLGPNYQFSTEVLTDGVVKGKVLQGNLYLKGKGDPTLLKEDLDQLASALKEQGISKIKGNLIGDDTWYDDVRLSLDLNWSDEPYYTGAQVSALTLSPNEDYDAGTVIVEVTPNKNGDQAKVKLTPHTDYVNIINKTEMVQAGQSKNISIEREHGSNNIIIEGQMPADGSISRSWASVWEPTGYALDVFKQSLEENGISLIGNSEVTYGATPEDATLLTSKDSMPLHELLVPFMKLSNNGHAEVLVKEMGRVVHKEGSWEKGLEVIEDVAISLGVDESHILLRDGSGMSHKNYIPASDLTQLLYAVQDREWYTHLEHSLPVAGASERLVGGTLRNRLKGEPTEGNVIAKTGSLTSVSTLSGYVTTQEGEKFIFSILNNNFLEGSVNGIQDEIVTTLAEYQFD